MNYPLGDIQNWLKSGVYAFINDSDKKVDVRYSKDCNKSIAMILSEINSGAFDVIALIEDFKAGKIQIKFLEESSDYDLNSRVCVFKWLEYFKNSGYSPYRDSTNMKVSITTKVESYGNFFCIVVKLRNSRRKEYTVGVFRKATEANNFIQKHYTPISNVVYADNEETKTYLDSLENNPEENPVKVIYEENNGTI